MFLAIGIILPFFTGQIKVIGEMLLPMHLPVMLCGFICGWQYGAAVGFILPVMRSALLGAPLMYPVAVAMSFELCAYGFLTGFLFSHSRWQCTRVLYRCLILSMLGGRIVWGLAELVLLGIKNTPFTLDMFISGAFANSIPGIILQLVLIPVIMLALNKTHMFHFKNQKGECGKNECGT